MRVVVIIEAAPHSIRRARMLASRRGVGDPHLVRWCVGVGRDPPARFADGTGERGALGEEGYQAAWQAGSGLSLDAAVDEVVPQLAAQRGCEVPQSL